jgi:hypothetical protein
MSANAGDFMKKYAQKKPVQDYKSEDFKENFEIIKAEQSEMVPL